MTKEEFLKVCNDPEKLTFGIKREIIESDLNGSCVQPKYGQYTNGQKYELWGEIRKKEGYNDLVAEEKIAQIEPPKTIAKYAELQRFLILAHFSNAFKVDVEELRKLHNIPLEGFKKSPAGLRSWCEKMKKEINRLKRSLWAIDMYDYLTAGYALRFTSEKRKAYLKKAFDCIASPKEAQNKCEEELFKINPYLEFMGPLPFLSSVDGIYRKYKLRNFWFYYLMKFVITGESLPPNAMTRPHLFLRRRGSFGLVINIHSWISKKDLTNLWPEIKSGLTKMFGTSKTVKNLYRDFLIFQLYAQFKEGNEDKPKSEEISRIMRNKYHYKTVTDNYVRAVLSKTKKVVKLIEKSQHS